MRRRKPNTIKILRVDQQEIKCLLSDGRTQQRVVRRAQVLLAMNDSEYLCRSLPALLQPFHSFKRVHLIWDGGPSHISAATNSFLRSRYGDWLRVVATPAHSSWLNQAEIFLKCFEVRYLQRGDWTSRQHLIDHLHASTPEYNRLWAQPINWSWTRRDLREWAEKKSTGLC